MHLSYREANALYPKETLASYTYIDDEGHTCGAWRKATTREEHALQTPESDPNHPIYNNRIFGYTQEEFLKKQYK